MDELLQAKIPGPDTGIEIKRTVCNLCCSAFYCGVDAYVREGRVIKLEGTGAHPMNRGYLCTKGYAGKEYLYSPKRIRTPLARVGPRGGDRFEAISWEEAYAEIARQLNRVKAEEGPEAVVFFSGVEKWYRFMQHRLAYSFGTPNYCTECSTCYGAMRMAWMLSAGSLARGDNENAGCYLGFSLNPHFSRFVEAVRMEEQKERGLKVVVIDPRVTPAVKRFADLHLQNLPGTDGAIALGIANQLIGMGAVDRDYIRQHVHGFEEFAAYARGFDPDRVEAISRVPAGLLVEAARLVAENLPVVVHDNFSALTHHVNGMQNYRAMLAISAITGSYDRKGGNVPRELTFSHLTAGFPTREEEFIQCRYPQGTRPPVGSRRFPLWQELEGEAHAMDLARQILTGDPYPLRAMVGFGMNYRMFPGDQQIAQAIHRLDFFANVDLFFTDTCRMADIVLPACTSFERSELKAYRGGYAYITKPAVPPLYDAKPDVEIITGLAEALELDDPLLRAGYESCVRYILQDLPVSYEALASAEFPVKIPIQPYVERAYTAGGYHTPTGKFELKSTLLECCDPALGYDPLPTYRESAVNADAADYPFLLFSGPRLPHTNNSRLHHIRSLAVLRKGPMADLSLQDAQALGLEEGDNIRVRTEWGSITLLANPSPAILPGTVCIPNGYPGADVNSIIHPDHLDPYSGFPGFRSVRCAVEAVGGGPACAM